MNILFLTDNFPPEVNAPATRTYEHCREWVRLGSKVTVITCVPNFPQGKIYSGYRNRFWQSEIVDGIRVIRVWTYITANEGFIKRSLDYMSFAVSAFFAGLFLQSDIIIATSPQFFTALSGYVLSKIKCTPWIFELRDLWPESIKALGAMNSTRVLNFLEKIELFLYRDCNTVIALTESFRDNLIQRGTDPAKICVVTNGANLDLYKPLGRDSELQQLHNLEGKFVVSYIGTHGMAHGLNFIIRAARKLSDPTIHFLFIGDGASKKALVRLAKECNLINVTFLDPIIKESVPRFLALSDVALVPLIKSDTFKTVIPSKIFEAAAMQIPILLGVDGEARILVEKYGCGLVFEPENEADFLDKLMLMKDDEERYQKYQRNCLKLAEDYNRSRLARVMLSRLQHVNSKVRA